MVDDTVARLRREVVEPIKKRSWAATRSST